MAAVGFGLGLLVVADLALGWSGALPSNVQRGRFTGYSERFPHFVCEEDRCLPARAELVGEQGFAARKAVGTVRVGVLGGSSVAGDHGLAAALGAALPAAEVIDGGGNGYGSSRVRLVYEELVDHDLDAVVVYTGHNEFNEARYVGELALPQTSRMVVQRGLRLSSTYRYLALWWQGRPGAVGAADVAPGGPLGVEEERLILARFEANLLSIAADVRARSLPAVFVLPASNPGVAPRTASDEARAAWRAAMRQVGKDAAGARLALDAVRDLDRSPDRATTATRDAVRRVAEAHGLDVVDAEAVLWEHDPEGYLVGEHSPDRMHLHPASYGLVAAAIVEAMERASDAGGR